MGSFEHDGSGQFYHVAISPKYPYYVYGGLQDNGTWGGPTLTLDGSGPVNEDWLSVSGGDGFMCRLIRTSRTWLLDEPRWRHESPQHEDR